MEFSTIPRPFLLAWFRQSAQDGKKTWKIPFISSKFRLTTRKARRGRKRATWPLSSLMSRKFFWNFPHEIKIKKDIPARVPAIPNAKGNWKENCRGPLCLWRIRQCREKKIAWQSGKNGQRERLEITLDFFLYFWGKNCQLVAAMRKKNTLEKFLSATQAQGAKTSGWYRRAAREAMRDGKCGKDSIGLCKGSKHFLSGGHSAKEAFHEARNWSICTANPFLPWFASFCSFSPFSAQSELSIHFSHPWEKLTCAARPGPLKVSWNKNWRFRGNRLVSFRHE